MKKQEQGLDSLPKITQLVNGHMPAAIVGILLHHVHSLILLTAPWFPSEKSLFSPLSLCISYSADITHSSRGSQETLAQAVNTAIL